jgi:transcriptional regulator with XRE-family HTH domain
LAWWGMPQVRTLSEYIASRRNELRLEQKEVSERLKRLGVDRAPTTVANWESGRQVVPLELIPALARALEESPVTLYDYAGLLSELPGSEIIKLLDGLSDQDVAKLERMIRAFVEDK